MFTFLLIGLIMELPNSHFNEYAVSVNIFVAVVIAVVFSYHPLTSSYRIYHKYKIAVDLDCMIIIDICPAHGN